MIVLCSQLTKPETQALPRFLIFHILFFLHDYILWFYFEISPTSVFFSVLHKPHGLSISPHQIWSALMQLSLNLSHSIQSYIPLIHSLFCERNLPDIQNQSCIFQESYHRCDSTSVFFSFCHCKMQRAAVPLMILFQKLSGEKSEVPGTH